MAARGLRRVTGAELARAGTYLRYPALTDLDTRVRRWAKWARALVVPADDKEFGGQKYVDLEKAEREAMVPLFKAAGLTERGDQVTCIGYGLTLRGQKGRSGLNTVKLTEQLVAGHGLERAVVEALIVACTEEMGKPSEWIEIDIPKYAKVRT